jgi:hypothetical protein
MQLPLVRHLKKSSIVSQAARRMMVVPMIPVECVQARRAYRLAHDLVANGAQEVLQHKLRGVISTTVMRELIDESWLED